MSLLNNYFTYRQVEEYLLGVPRFAGKNTVEETGIFYGILGTPGGKAKIIHVAGTNGKGSVCSYMCSILCKAGYSVGMFTSPHLIEMRERFRINKAPVEKEEFTQAFQTVMDRLDDMRINCGRPDYHPTFFELLFLMGMVIFEQKNVDYIILETGMGGRLDATNCIKGPKVCVITEIGLDHMQYLGDTVEEIAGEKAGILKEGVPVVFCDKRKETTEVIQKRAETLGIPMFPVGEKDYFDVKIANKNIDFSLHSRYDNYIRLSVASKALYQVENASVAVRSIEVLDSSQNISKEQIADGICEAVWEGRMEEVLPGIFVDGAHNEDAIGAFVQTVKGDQCRGKRYLLFSVSSDKDYDTMVRLLEADGLFSKSAVTKFADRRVVPLEQIRRIFEKYASEECFYYEKTEDAFEYLIHEKTENDYIYIVGSLYLVGEIKALVGRKRND